MTIHRIGKHKYLELVLVVQCTRYIDAKNLNFTVFYFFAKKKLIKLYTKKISLLIESSRTLMLIIFLTPKKSKS